MAEIKVIQGTGLPVKLVKAFRIACIEKDFKMREVIAVIAQRIIDGGYDGEDFGAEMKLVMARYGD